MAFPLNLFLASLFVSHRQNKKARKRARRARREAAIRQVTIRETNAGVPLVLPLGRTGVQGTPVKGDVGRDIVAGKPPSSAHPIRVGLRQGSALDVDLAAGQSFGGLTIPYEGEKNYGALCAQWALCEGPVEAVTDVSVYDESIRSHKDYKIEWRNGATPKRDANGVPLEPDDAATSYSKAAVSYSSGNVWQIDDSRDAKGTGSGRFKTTDTFTGMTYATVFYRHDLDEPAIAGDGSLNALGLFAKVSGALTRRVVESGGVHSLAAPEFSPSWARNVLMVLMRRLGLTEADLHLDTFKEAQDIGDAIALGAGEQTRNIGEYSRENPYGFPPGLPGGLAPWAVYREGRGFGPGNAYGPAGRTNPTQPLLRYEANGPLWSSETPSDALEMLMECAPGAQFFRARDGRYKLIAPLARTEPQDTIDGSILLEAVEVIYPDDDTKYNRVNARFPNLFKDLTHDDIESPFPRVPKLRVDASNNPVLDGNGNRQYDTEPNPAVALFKALDGGKTLSNSLDLELTNNIYHGYSIATTDLLLSRRPRYRLRTTEYGVIYEPGDLVRIVDDGVDAEAMIDSFPELSVEDGMPSFRFSAVEFRETDYEFHLPDRDTFEYEEQPARVRLSRPVRLNASYLTRTREFTLTVVPNDNPTIWENGYVFEYRSATAAQGDPWNFLGTLERDFETFRFVPPFLEGEWFFRVATRGIGGATGQWRATENAVLWDGTLAALPEGARVYFRSLLPGVPPDVNLGETGDVLVDSSTSTIWERRPDVMADEEIGRGGLLARKTGQTLTWVAAEGDWTSSPALEIPGFALDYPPGFLNGVKIPRLSSSVRTGNYEADVTHTAVEPIPSPQGTVTYTNDVPDAGSGVVGQGVTRNRQSWRKTAGPWSDPISEANAASGVLARWTGLRAHKVRRRVGSVGASDLHLPVADALMATPNGYLDRVIIRTDSPNFLVNLQFQTTLSDQSLANDDLTSALEPHVWLAWRIGTVQFAVPLGDFTTADTDEPYIFPIPAAHQAAASAFAAAWYEAAFGPGATTSSGDSGEFGQAGSEIDFMLLDIRRRDPANPLSPWHKVAALGTPDFSIDMQGNALLAVSAIATNNRLGLQGEAVSEASRISGTGPDYAWPKETFRGFGELNFLAASISDATIALIDGRARSVADPLNPWIPFDFARGRDGLGIEEIFASSASQIYDASGRGDPSAPDGNWPYDQPMPPWSDGWPSNLTAQRPWVFRARRRVPGQPARGAARQPNWSDWVVGPAIHAFGMPGVPGINGLPGMTRFMRMNKLVNVPPRAGQTTPHNPGNPHRRGEYAIVRRGAGTAGRSTQDDITSWANLYDRPGANENLTLRLNQLDAEGRDGLSYLRRVPQGAVITFFPVVKADGSLDPSVWIDFVVERSGAIGLFEEERDADGNAFVGFHIERIERSDGARDYLADLIGGRLKSVHFGFSWIGPDAVQPAVETDGPYYMKADAMPAASAIPTAQAFGTAPAGWSATRPARDQLPGGTKTIWTASRQSSARTVWLVAQAANGLPIAAPAPTPTPPPGQPTPPPPPPRDEYEEEVLYRLSPGDAEPPGPSGNLAWGSESSLWRKALPSASRTHSVWKAQRGRNNPRVPLPIEWTVSQQEAREAPPPPGEEPPPPTPPPTREAQSQTFYRLWTENTEPPAPSASLAWGAVPNGWQTDPLGEADATRESSVWSWTRTREPTPMTTDAWNAPVWAANGVRIREKLPPPATPTPPTPTPTPAPTPAPAPQMTVEAKFQTEEWQIISGGTRIQIRLNLLISGGVEPHFTNWQPQVSGDNTLSALFTRPAESNVHVYGKVVVRDSTQPRPQTVEVEYLAPIFTPPLGLPGGGGFFA